MKEEVNSSEIEKTIFKTLSYYKSFETNRFQTNSGLELKKLLEKKEKTFRDLHDKKLAIDKKALF